MATTILIVCPECGKQIKAPDNVIGKKIRCKFCQAAFVASKGTGKPAAGKPAKPGAAKPAKPPAAKPAKPAEDDEDDDSNPYGLTEISLAPRCPDCANDMEEGQVICLICGYNTRTREKGRTVKTYDNTVGEQFMWLLPGIVCVLAILATIIFDIWYLMKIEEVVDLEAWWGKFLAHGGIKLWVVIISLFILFFTGKFAIKRLIINFSKPEAEKLK